VRLARVEGRENKRLFETETVFVPEGPPIVARQFIAGYRQPESVPRSPYFSIIA
jgi:hypothetical protein